MRGTAVFLFMLACAGTAARADDLVCASGQIVEVDMTITQVLEKCGPPTHREVRMVQSRARGNYGGVYKVGDTKVEIWRYDRGSRRQAAVLEFRDDKVFSITYVEDR